MRHEQEAGTKWKRNGTHLPQAHEKLNTYFFIFLQQLMGGGEFCGIECWKVGNKFYVFGTIFFGIVAVKLFLLFNILNFYHKAFLAWNGVVKNP